MTKCASVEPLTYLDMRYIQVDITVFYEFQTLKKIEVRKYRIKKKKESTELRNMNFLDVK